MTKLSQAEFEYKINQTEIVGNEQHMMLYLYNFAEEFIGNYLQVQIN